MTHVSKRRSTSQKRKAIRVKRRMGNSIVFDLQ
jgi:hypothetical protein